MGAKKKNDFIWYLLQIVEGILCSEVMKFLVHEEIQYFIHLAFVLLFWI